MPLTKVDLPFPAFKPLFDQREHLALGPTSALRARGDRNEVIVFHVRKVGNELRMRKMGWSEGYAKHDYVREAVSCYLKSRSQIIVMDNQEKTNSGVTEEYFFQFLRRKFGSSIQRDKSVLKGRVEFFPDFVLLVESLNLYFDIEIDEPYVGFSGKPIHHIASGDESRNRFFTSNNWVVIRFAESQIIQEPESCCKLIENVVNWFSNYGEIDCPVKRVPKWTFREAQDMSFDKERESYLPEEFWKKLDS